MANLRDPNDQHAGHDELLLVAYAAGDVTLDERASADALVAGCALCAALVGDVRAIATATAALPAPVRSRDFRLTPADAARLRPAGWRGLAAALTRWRGFARSLGTVLATLGIAGLLLGMLPGVLPGAGGAGGAAPATTQREAAPAEVQASGSPSPIEGVGGGAAKPAPVPSGSPMPGPALEAIPVAPSPSAAPATPGATAGTFSSAREAPSQTPVATGAPGALKVVPAPASQPPASQPTGAPSPLVVGSAALLVTGLALLGVGFRRRRA